MHLEEDPSAYCAFTANAVPELERAGFVVELDPSYPYRLVQSELELVLGARRGRRATRLVQSRAGRGDRRQRVNLVPVLLEMLERSGELASLRALERGTERLLVVQAGDHGYVRVEPERLKRLWSVLVAALRARR